MSTAFRKPDVALVLNVANGYWLPLLASRGIPTLVNVDGMEWEREKWGPGAKRVFRGGAHMTAKFATEIVCDARAIAERWVSEFSRESTFIPYGGTPPSESSPPEFLGLRPYILMVARFVPENTVGEFLEAASILSEMWDVVLVGSSGYGGELDRRAAEIDREHRAVHWLGHVNDDDLLFSLWSNASVYFHGHSVGGTNPALVQAMACSAPTVARDTIYNREVLGDSALFCDPSVDSIVSNVGLLMDREDLRIKFAESVRVRSEAVYSWPLVCTAYEEALRGLTA
ncbi:glycosyltransferase [Rhodococcoides fascians]|uniref:glycosyltransferase n=1 Tax=Rhodococcoides fascians TaxID=1828 RepID=UPI00315A76AF